MVLLCNDNHFNIQKLHTLKCLNKTRDNFKVEVVPLKEGEKLIDNNIDYDILNRNISDKDIKTILADKKTK
jgi:hypothetical protein